MNRISQQRRRRRRKPDDGLIRDCVIYAQAIAAVKAGYDADPDSDGRYAGRLGTRYVQRAARALGRVAERHSETTLGLEAKARIVPIIVSKHLGLLSAQEAELISAFADEVRAELSRQRLSG